MITFIFTSLNGATETRTFGAWCRPSVIQAYCDKLGLTAEIVATDMK